MPAQETAPLTAVAPVPAYIPATAPPAPAPPERAAKKGLPLPLLAGIAAVLILVAAGAAWALTRGDNETDGPVVAAPNSGQLVTVTIAGDGDPLVLNRPGSVAVDGSGKVYVTDELNHRIRVITPERTISTLAGSGVDGFGNGPGPTAQFDTPFGVAVDGSGRVYVADTYNNRIRAISPQGEVITLAGTGREGSADGPANVAEFFSPTGVAVDSAGNVYVADFDNHKVRKITPNGTVTTLAGSGQPGFSDGLRNGARFNGPRSVAVDAAGNVYVADHDNNRIRKVEPDGAVTTLAGSDFDGFADGPGAGAQFSAPGGVAVDAAGNVYVADGGNRRIRKITPAGEVTTLAGSGAQGMRDGPALDAQFGLPTGVAVDKAGNIYVGDWTTHRVRVITTTPGR
jgi:sugar lactone lactonase YvrE